MGKFHFCVFGMFILLIKFFPLTYLSNCILHPDLFKRSFQNSRYCSEIATRILIQPNFVSINSYEISKFYIVLYFEYLYIKHVNNTFVLGIFIIYQVILKYVFYLNLK